MEIKLLMQSAGKCTSYGKKQFYTCQCLKLCWTADWHPFEICEVYSSVLSARPPESTINLKQKSTSLSIYITYSCILFSADQ